VNQDTVNYTLRKGRKTVYKGITNNPGRREKEHKVSGKKFTSMTTSRRESRSTARKREKAGIKGYKRAQRYTPTM
jgi:predicted GIY-YIG superfamily endonuclease